MQNGSRSCIPWIYPAHDDMIGKVCDPWETQQFSKTRAATTTLIDGNLIWCRGKLPYVPSNLRKMLFDTFHRLHHPGPDITAKKMASKYYWSGMTQQIKSWASECDVCQRSKAKPTINPPMDNRPVSYPKFQDIQVDVVGPLEESHGFKYLLTVICRSTNWFVAAPMKEANAETCAEAFDMHWYGCRNFP